MSPLHGYTSAGRKLASREEETILETYTISRPPLKATCVRRLPRELADRWIDERSSWFQAADGADDATRGSRIARIAVVTSWGPGAFAKREAGKLARGIFGALAGSPSRPRKAFEIGLLLERAGVDAARPLALIENRRAGIVRESCVVLERIEGATLRDFILERLPRLESQTARERLKEGLWSELSAQVAKLHAARVRQRDLKAVNIIVSDAGRGAPRAALIDLEGMARLSGPPSLRVRVRDLARLAVSLREEAIAAAGVDGEDWKRFVASYLEAATGTAPSCDDVDRFVAGTLSWAERKEARNRRRGRVIH